VVGGGEHALGDQQLADRLFEQRRFPGVGGQRRVLVVVMAKRHASATGSSQCS
jgi:hypothetical protein